MGPLYENTETGISIRHATPVDIEAILAIRNDAILTSTALWIDEPTDLAERTAWWNSHTGSGNPVIVAVREGEVAGYATYSPWRTNDGFRHTLENSVYLADGHRGVGIGRLLMIELIGLAKAAGHHAMIADIEGGNEASIRLHERLGFVRDGFVPEAGTKFGRWFDLVIMRLPLE